MKYQLSLIKRSSSLNFAAEVTHPLPLGDSVECAYNFDIPTCLTLPYHKDIWGQISKMISRNLQDKGFENCGAEEDFRNTLIQSPY